METTLKPIGTVSNVPARKSHFLKKKLNMLEKALEIAELLCVSPPCPGASDEDIRVWIDWYISSYKAALEMSQETIERMKAERHWPPVVASMIRVAPRAVRESIHPHR